MLGNMSPITMGLLALLAYRTYQGKGRLADMLGGGQQPTGNSVPGVSPGEQTMGGRNPGPGRFTDGNPAEAPASAPGGGLGDLLRGGLGGLLGGAAAGTLLTGGLGDLVRRFQQNGFGETADSWVGRGANREIAPHEIESAVGQDTLRTLSDETGRPYNEVLSELSQSLPTTVDALTPEGRLPTEDEAQRWV